MSNCFQKILNWVYENFKKDASKMLIWTGVAGWTLSSLAQAGAVLFNKEIPKEQKSYLIPQELADAAINIIGCKSFVFLTLFVKIHITTAKIKPFQLTPPK